MTLKNLRIFSEVCRLESITKAAEELNMAQPAVSYVIRELENYYGTRLFERMNRKLYITDAGRCLLNYADSILLQTREVRDILRDTENAVKVRVGSNASFGIGRLPGILAGFQSVYSEIPVCSVIHNSGQIEEMLLQNKLDFGVMDSPVSHEMFISRMIGWDKMTAVCAVNYPLPSTVDVTDVLRMPLLLREPGSGSRKQIEQLMEQERISPDIAAESISIESLAEMCRLGMGVLFLPESVAEPYITGGMLKRIDMEEFVLKREYFLAYHKSKYLTKSMQKFRDYLMQAAAGIPLADCQGED